MTKYNVYMYSYVMQVNKLGQWLILCIIIGDIHKFIERCLSLQMPLFINLYHFDLRKSFNKNKEQSTMEYSITTIDFLVINNGIQESIINFPKIFIWVLSLFQTSICNNFVYLCRIRLDEMTKYNVYSYVMQVNKLGQWDQLA